MKNLKIGVALFLATSCFFTACKDDSSNKEVFSELTPEQHKKEIEDEGVKFVDNISSVANLTSFDVFKQFSINMENSGAFGANTVVVTNLIKQVEGLKSGPKVSLDLKSYAATETNESITAMFSEISGIYTWNSTLGDWDKVESGSELTFNYALEDGQLAKISISEFIFVEALNQVGEGFILELPTSIKMAVTLGEATLCTLTVSGEYYDDDMPKKVSETITLEGFTFTSMLDLTNKSKLKTNTSFDYDGEVIFASGVEVAGDMNFDAINGEEASMNILDQNIIDNANAYFQLGNVKTEGLIDFVGMSDDIQKLTEETATEESLMEIFNNNIKAYIRYADSNEIIANSEFYMYEKAYTYTVYDSDLQQYVDVTETETEMDMRMVFPDGSKINGDYFNNGFGDMISSMNNLITEMNTNYDMELDIIN